MGAVIALAALVRLAGSSISGGHITFHLDPTLSPLTEDGYSALANDCQQARKGVIRMGTDELFHASSFCDDRMAAYMNRVANATRCRVVDSSAPSRAAPRYSGAKGEAPRSFKEMQEEVRGAWWTVCGWELEVMDNLHLQVLARMRASSYALLERSVARHKVLQPLLKLAQHLKRQTSNPFAHAIMGAFAMIFLAPAFLVSRLIRRLRQAPSHDETALPAGATEISGDPETLEVAPPASAEDSFDTEERSEEHSPPADVEGGYRELLTPR